MNNKFDSRTTLAYLVLIIAAAALLATSPGIAMPRMGPGMVPNQPQRIAPRVTPAHYRPQRVRHYRPMRQRQQQQQRQTQTQTQRVTINPPAIQPGNPGTLPAVQPYVHPYYRPAEYRSGDTISCTFKNTSHRAKRVTVKVSYFHPRPLGSPARRVDWTYLTIRENSTRFMVFRIPNMGKYGSHEIMADPEIKYNCGQSGVGY